MALTNNNKYIISGSSDKSIKIFDLHTKLQLHQFVDAHSGILLYPITNLSSFIDSVNSVVVSSDDKLIVSGSADKSIKTFDIQKREKVQEFLDIHTGIILLPYLLEINLLS